MKKYNESYSEGKDLNTAFVQFMNKVITDKGIIFIDPTDIEIKKLLKPVFETELILFRRYVKNRCIRELGKNLPFR